VDQEENLSEPKRRVVDPDNAYTPEYRATLEAIQESGECPAPFCKQSAEYHKHPVIHDGEFWKVTNNTFNYKGAVLAALIVHKEHITDIDGITDAAWVEFLRILKMLKLKYDIEGGSFFCRFGDTQITGATVLHLHAHLVVGVPRSGRIDGRNEPIKTRPIRATVGFKAKQ
jgi:ATP adenylyltransferase